MDANFFIIISFSIFGFIFFKKLWPGILEQLDQYIVKIKEDFSQKHSTIAEYEKLKTLCQERLQELHREIEEIKKVSSQKLNFLKTQLQEELETQYIYRQKSFQQTIERMQKQHRKKLQDCCVEEIIENVKKEIKKSSLFSDEYMVSVIRIHEKNSHLKS